MDMKLVFDSFLNNPYIHKYFSQLKSDTWSKLSNEEKLGVYDYINKFFCNSINIKPYICCYNKDNVGQFNRIDHGDFDNVVFKDNQMIINDIDYNQYATLFEYFIKVINRFQRKVCFSNYSDHQKIDIDTKEKWKKDLEIFRFGPIVISQNSKNFQEFSTVAIDAKNCAEEILFTIVKNNYEYGNSFDEEYFMSNRELMMDKSILKIGKDLVKSEFNKNSILIDGLKDLSNRIKKLRELEDISEASDEDLFCAIYPEIVDIIDIITLVKIYNEIVVRLFGDDINIRLDKNKVFINGHSYGIANFKNYAFNILLEECFEKMDELFLNDFKFLNSRNVKVNGLKNSINKEKRKWLAKVIEKVDNSLFYLDFGVVRYMPLSRLLHRENLRKHLESTTLSNFNKRGK